MYYKDHIVGGRYSDRVSLNYMRFKVLVLADTPSLNHAPLLPPTPGVINHFTTRIVIVILSSPGRAIMIDWLWRFCQ